MRTVEQGQAEKKGRCCSAERLSLLLLLLLYLGVGVLYAFLTPPWQVPDEPAHFNYVRHIWQTHRLPVLQAGDYDQAYLERIKAAHFPPQMSVNNIRYEAHQPPLYYVSAALLLAPLAHAPQMQQLYALRLYSLFLGLLSLLVIYKTFRLVFPAHAGWALAGVAFVAFLPQHLAMMAGVDNDAMAELALNVTLYFSARFLLRTQRDWRDYAALGLAVVAVIWTKMTAYVVLPTAFLALLAGNFCRGRWLHGWQPVPDRTARWQRLLWGVVVPLSATLLWFGRNVLVYGDHDILGLRRHAQVVVGQPRTADFIAAHGVAPYLDRLVSWTFNSFWGQFGWMGVLLNRRLYTLFLYLTAVMVLAGGYFLYKLFWESTLFSLRQKVVILLAQLSAVGTIVAYLWYNISFLQTQGRYLFPALLPWVLVVIPGLWFLLQPDLEPILALGFAGGALWAVFSAALHIFDLHKWDALILAGWSFYFLLGRKEGQRRRSVLLFLPFLGLSGLAVIILYRFILPGLALP